MTLLLLIFVAILGLLIGSLLNACIYRWSHNYSLIKPLQSQCPTCEHSLGPRDLIPLFSYLCLGGRCRYCSQRISGRYPLVELLTAAGFVGTTLVTADLWLLIVRLVLLSALIVVFFADLEEFIVPDQALLSAGLVTLAYAIYQGTWASALWGALIAGGILALIAISAWIYYRFEAMGQGDIKLALLLGLYLGPVQALFALYLAFLLGGIAGLGLLLAGQRKRHDLIPFGPALVLGALPFVYYGPQLIELIRWW